MKFKHLTINCQLFSYSVILSFILFFSSPLKAQVTIGSQSVPDGNALLDLRQNTVDSLSTKGLLLPRVALTSTTSSSPLTVHVKGMFVYNTATANDVKPGIYYNDGTQWMTSTAVAATAYSATAPITLSGTAIGFTSGNIATGTSAAGATAPLTVDVTASRLVGGNSTFTVNNTAPLWNANQLQGKAIVTTAPAIGQVLTFNGTSWAPASSAASWLTAGNAGTNPTNNFIGTTDNQPLMFRINNQPAGTINHTLTQTALGYAALASNATGTDNTAVGDSALFANLVGGGNTAVGAQALLNNTTASQNTAIGNKALYYNTTGNNNCAIGTSALGANTTGNNSIAVGNAALGNNITGIYNIALGNAALPINMTGNNNTAIGYCALNFNTSGNNSTAIGNYALYYSQGNGNIALGDSAGYNINAGSSYNVVIGYKVTASSAAVNNEVTIGTNGSTTSTYRMFGAAWTSASDRRLKHDIQPIGQGLDFVMNLKPVEFVYNDRRDNLKSLGFIAQDVQETMNQNNMSNYELVTKLVGDTLGLTATELIPVLTKAIQEQQATIANEQTTIANEQTTIAQLQRQISDLTQRLEAVEQKKN